MNFKPNMLFLNRSFDKKRLKALLLWFRLNLSENAALKAVEILQGLGFRSATQGAISLGLDDLKTPTSKGGRVFQAQVEVALAHHEHHRGNRTPVELFQHLVDTWHRTSQDLTTEVVQLFHSTERVNPVYMMAFSGARGNISQVRQLVGMRGLMADPRGQIVGFPILSNFREGLTITEYFVSCYGARKGVVDTAIRTADAGYLTRRLADVSHHVVVRTTNCGTHESILLRDIKEGQKTILSLTTRLVGRVLAEHVFLPASPTSNSSVSHDLPHSYASPSSLQSSDFLVQQYEKSEAEGTSFDEDKTKTIIYRNSEITSPLASKLAAHYLEVPVRSPLSCSLPWGVCQLCYGWGLSEGRRVTLGEAVGIIAAQSIGEPGTQLTLRTFHTGGVFSGELLNEIRAPYNGNVIFPTPLQGLLLRTPHGQIAFLTKVSGKMNISETEMRFESKRENLDTSILLQQSKGNSFFSKFNKTTDSSAMYTSESCNSGQSTEKLTNQRSQDALLQQHSATQLRKPLPLQGTGVKLRKPLPLCEAKGTGIKVMDGKECEKDMMRRLPKHEDLFEKKQIDKINDTKNELSLPKQDSEFIIQPSTVIFVKQKEHVVNNQLLAEFSSSTLQSVNDQIEITQQVLSDTAGQIWFKELEYGNRKGPGSGSLGTYFSSQKLGGIWVLAGKPMIDINPSFVSPPPSFSTQSKEEAGVPYAVPYKGKGLFHQLSAITRVNPYPLEVGAVAKDTLLRDAPYPCVQSKPYMGKGLLPLYPLHTPYGVSTRVRAFTPVPFAYSLRSKHKGKGSAALPLWGQQLTAMVRESSHYPCLNLQFRQQSGSYVNDFRGAEVKTCTRVSSEYKTKSFFNLAPRPAKESENEKFIPFKGRQAGLTKQGYGYQRFAKSLKSFIPLVTIVRGKQKLQLQIEDLSENTLSSNIIKEGINNGRSPSTNVFINTNLLLHENKISFSNNCDKFLVFNNFVLRNLNKSPKINKSLLKRKNLFKYHTYGIQNKLKRAINTRYSKTCTTSIINLQNNYDYSLKSSGLLRENVFKYDYILGYSQAANSKTPSIYFSRKATSQNNSKSLLFKYHKNNKFLIDTRQEKDLESQTIDKSIKCHYSQPAMDSVGVKAPYVQSKATQLRKPLPLQGTGVKLRKPLPLCLLHKEYAKGMLRILLRSKQSVALQGVKTQYSAYTNGRNFLTSTNQRFVRKADAYKSSICTYKLPVVVVRRSLPFVRFVQQALWGKQSRKALLLQYVQNKAGISSQEQRAFTPVPFAYSLRSKHKGKGSVAEKQRGTRITHDKFFEKIENKIKKNTLVFQELRSYESQFTLGKTRKSTKKLNMLPLLSEGDLVTFVTNSDHNHTQCKLNAVQVRAFLDVKGKNKKPMGLACKGMAKSCFAIENVISFPPIPVLSPLTPYFNKTSFSFSTPYPLQSYANKSYLSTVLINKDITRIHPCDNRKTITCKAMDNLIKSNPPATARNTLPIIARDTPPIIAKDTLINCFVSQGNKSSYFVTEKRRLQSTWIQKKRAYLTYLNQVSSIPFTQQFSKCTNEYTAEAFTNFISRTNIQLSTFRISSKNFTSHYLTSKIYKPLSNIIKASASDPLPLCLLRKEYAKGTGVKLRKPLPLCLLRKEYAKGIGVKTLWGKNNETTIITNGLSLGDNTPPAGDTVPVMARELPPAMARELPPAMARELPPAMARELPPAVIKKNFLGENKRTPLFPGQLVTYGDNIANNIVSTESGQVLYIDSQKTTLRKAQTVLIYSRAIIAVLSGDWIKKGTPLMSLSYQKLVTGDIVQGLPKIEQFFEAPVLRDGTFWSDSLQAKLNQFFQEEREKLPLAEAVRKGFSEIQRVLVEGVLRVYISQGVLIADKHLEVIVRQMTCKGRILYSGDTGFLRNELVSLDKIENVNQVTYGQKALYHPQVRGITDASLESESFLSAASFQETTRVLSRDAIIGKTDLMRGLKERVIVGELIQAGTGLANNSVYNLLAHSVT